MIELGITALGIGLTVGVYAAALCLAKKVTWAHPLVVTCVVLVAVLRIFHIRQQDYQEGGGWISYLLGPATIALGVPMYRHAKTLRRSLRILSVAVVAGAAVGMLTAGVAATLLGAPRQLVLSTLPKSVTTPIAMEVARQLHGVPELAAAMAVIAGLLGSLIGPPLLRYARVSHDLAVGAAIGTSSHGIGTARLVRDSELQASTSSLAMALAGIATSLLAMAVPWILR